MNLIEQHNETIKQLCIKHKVKKLRVFGSLLTDNFAGTSDVDLVAEFDDSDLDDYAENYFEFKFSLENILKTSVDLLEDKAIKNPYLRQAIDSTARLLYGH